MRLTLVLLGLLILASFGYFLIKKYRHKQTLTKNTAKTLNKLADISVETFSGDNRYDTQLDLAKAYVELQNYEQAKQLLKSVINHGVPHQIFAARQMFSLLLKKERQ